MTNVGGRGPVGDRFPLKPEYTRQYLLEAHWINSSRNRISTRSWPHTDIERRDGNNSWTSKKSNQVLTSRGCYAMTPLGFTTEHNQTIQDTGGCPQLYVDSEASCAIQCALNTWCRVYVMGPCDRDTPNPCLCVICQMDPIIDQHKHGVRSVGTLTIPKRLVDGDSGELQWSMVHPSCMASVFDISSNFGISPILALQLVEIKNYNSTQISYIASPVCPPTFTPRGQVKCHDTEGIWHGQNSLACFSLECYQTREDKQYYAGCLNVSISGRPCWHWQHQGPVENNMMDFSYDFDNFDIVQAKNYCRVFLDEEGIYKIWCYNADYDKDADPLRWEYCSVPPCYGIY
ncbi:hypothetical protein RRG08_030694 [Elysia crispata]|uniref:Kringle domain-containing protein n=1 Tax=Elysia crispata TaxID=231223 RepID=A0AAE0Y483_9GAST|nr:hypothetical protein RRG08_030694 [Elysia crispata]